MKAIKYRISKIISVDEMRIVIADYTTRIPTLDEQECPDEIYVSDGYYVHAQDNIMLDAHVGMSGAWMVIPAKSYWTHQAFMQYVAQLMCREPQDIHVQTYMVKHGHSL